MFDNIGSKVKGLASVVCIGGIVTSIISGLAMMISLESFLAGFLSMIVGALGSWIGSWALYAIGEAVDAANAALSKTYELARMLERFECYKKPVAPSHYNAPGAGSNYVYGQPLYGQGAPVPPTRPVPQMLVPAWKQVQNQNNQTVEPPADKPQY